MSKTIKRIVALALCLVLCMGILVDVQAAALRITRQPKSVEAMVGEKATFSIVAKGDGLKYQWYYKDPGMSAFKKVANATKAKYTVTMKAALDGRQFYCQVTDQNKKKVKSNKATLTWDTTLAITGQPKSAAVKDGETAKITVKANGKGLSYAWWVKFPDAQVMSSDADGFFLTEITTASLTFPMSEMYDGTQAYCVVTDETGATVQSNTVTITLFRPIVITRQPADVTVMNGQAAKVSLRATAHVTGAKLTYLWWTKAPGAEKFVKTTVTKNSYSVAMKPELSGTQVYCVIKDGKGNTLRSETATLTWDPTLAILTQPKNVSVENAKTAKVSVVANGAGLTYAWYAKEKDADDFVLTSKTTAAYSVRMAEAVDGRQLYCVITDETGATITSNTVTLTMKRPIVITKQPKDMYVLKGKTAKVSLAATGKKLTYVWYVKAPGAKRFVKSNVTTNYYSVKMTAKVNGTQVYCLITDRNKKKLKSEVVTLGMVAAGTKFASENGEVTITGYTGALKSLTIPSSINGLPVTAVKADAFADSALTKLVLPDSIVTIGENAFKGSALTTLRIPAGVTEIPAGAFNGCASLTSVTLPDCVTVIGKQAFANCTALEEMTTY